MFRSSNGVSSTSINHSDKLIAVPHFNVVDIRDISIDNIATVKRMDTCYMIRVREQDNLYTNVVGPDLTGEIVWWSSVRSKHEHNVV